MHLVWGSRSLLLHPYSGLQKSMVPRGGHQSRYIFDSSQTCVNRYSWAFSIKGRKWKKHHHLLILMLFQTPVFFYKELKRTRLAECSRCSFPDNESEWWQALKMTMKSIIKVVDMICAWYSKSSEAIWELCLYEFVQCDSIEKNK